MSSIQKATLAEAVIPAVRRRLRASRPSAVQSVVSSSYIDTRVGSFPDAGGAELVGVVEH